jgi:hypothetical protein
VLNIVYIAGGWGGGVGVGEDEGRGSGDVEGGGDEVLRIELSSERWTRREIDR